MKFVGILDICFMLPLLAAAPAMAGIQLYRGEMEAETAPSTTFEGVLGKHPTTLVIIEDRAQKGLNGYFESDMFAVGKLAGSDPAHLRVSYPWQDGSENTLSLSCSGATKLKGELIGATKVISLHLRHWTPDIDNSLMTKKPLPPLSSGWPPSLKPKAALYQAFSLTQNGNCEGALPLFEKSLGLADAVFGQGSPQLNHFIMGLANCYAKLGRAKEFNALFDQTDQHHLRRDPQNVRLPDFA